MHLIFLKIYLFIFKFGFLWNNIIMNIPTSVLKYKYYKINQNLVSKYRMTVAIL